jgi:hypothetical protein
VISKYSLRLLIIDKFYFRQADYTLAKGTKKVLSTNVKKIEFVIVNENNTTDTHETMELA